MTTEEIARAVGGTLLSGPSATAAAGAAFVPVSGVSTDSRTVSAGNLFVAIPGEKFDGHAFVAQAVGRGAVAALISTNQAEGLRSLGIPLIGVEGDVLVALASLARVHRERFAIPVVGITGSAGKTTAKEMTAAVLASPGTAVLKTEGNLNNRIGVPLTVMGMDRTHGAAVIEMGISLPGEMNELVRAAKPTVRVLLVAGLSHVEFLKDEDGVAAEKGHIFDGAAPEDWIVFNADDHRVAREAGRRDHPNKLSFGTAEDADVRAVEVEPTALGEQRLVIDIQGKSIEVRLRAFGGHMVTNALAAAAVGTALELPVHEIVDGLENRFRPVPGRGDVHRLGGDVVLVDDSYNANPTSMAAAFHAVGALKAAGRGRAIAAVGDMLELGPGGADAHADAGRAAKDAHLDAIYAFGPLSARLAEEAGKAGVAVRTFADRPALTKALESDLQAGDALLVKGSRGMRMDEIVSSLLAARGEEGVH